MNIRVVEAKMFGHSGPQYVRLGENRQQLWRRGLLRSPLVSNGAPVCCHFASICTRSRNGDSKQKLPTLLSALLSRYPTHVSHAIIDIYQPSGRSHRPISTSDANDTCVFVVLQSLGDLTITEDVPHDEIQLAPSSVKPVAEVKGWLVVTLFHAAHFCFLR